MLGSVVAEYLTCQGHDVVSTSRLRTEDQVPNQIDFDALQDDISKLKFEENQYDYVINCIGLIKSLISDSVSDRELAIRINSLFPINLNKEAEKSATKVIQIGTDCVYSGNSGGYSENSTLDPVDIYGYSKALGEFSSQNQMLLRCSIVGRERKNHYSLMDWTLNQPLDSSINGFTNHLWNGITTLSFSKIVNAVIENGLFSPETIHIVPSGHVSKYELVSLFAQCFDRRDLKIIRKETEFGVNRTLSSVKPKTLTDIWKAAGYQDAPSHHEMILEYSQYLGVKSRNGDND